ncbi:MAG: DUF86 domain-containing protein [Rhodobacteraceae bacterium]|nr:DUF86 domain-containing protein [Paracoccaceae bacterium]MCY4198059.1 DUF86 domain-containing protein [Paracoccaceae bacterium]MCY4327697.1 DUF86 domain-containing protein [Paracoccaceae bacterium]
MRNRLTHVYFETDRLAVWDTAINDIPELHKTVGQLLSELSSPSPSEEHKTSPQPATQPEPPKTNDDDDLLVWQQPPDPFGRR